MSIIGKVDGLWRYRVKSMRGEEMDDVFVGFSAAYGDRLIAISSSASPKGFPYLTAGERQRLLRYRPRFRHPDKAARPINLAEAESIGPGLNPVSADSPDLMVDVEAPTGETLAIDDPAAGWTSLFSDLSTSFDYTSQAVPAAASRVRQW